MDIHGFPAKWTQTAFELKTPKEEVAPHKEHKFK